jgi:hypothetical protein
MASEGSRRVGGGMGGGKRGVIFLSKKGQFFQKMGKFVKNRVRLGREKMGKKQCFFRKNGWISWALAGR